MTLVLPSKALSTPKKILFTVALCSFGLALAEGIARFADFVGKAKITRGGQDLPPHRSRIWGLRLGRQTAFLATFDVGDNGLRVIAETGAPLRALTLGDSSIFGHGLADNDTLHASLRRALAAEGVDVDVLDGGIPGYSSEQSRKLLEEVGWDVHPNLLVIGNLWSDTGARGFQDREWMAELQTTAFAVQWVLRKSVLWTTLGTRLKEASAPTELPDSIQNHPGGSLPVTWVKDPDQVGVRRVPIDVYAENLDWMLREASARGIGTIFLSPCNRILARFDEDRPTSWGVYFHTMNRVAARRGIPVVHGCDVVVEEALYDDLGFLDEMHPTAALNAAYAERLSKALRIAGWPKNPLLPDPAPAPWSEQLVDEWILSNE